MIKKVIGWVVGLLILCTTSCINIFNRNGGLWFYAYSNEATASAFNLTPASFLSLNPDKTYTFDFGQFDYGKWIKHGDSLILHSVGGKIYNWQISSESSNDLKLMLAPNVISDFTIAPASYKSESGNPFSLTNNKWRLPATHKESVEEIRVRLINHCSFWKTYFLWGIDNNVQYMDVRSTPTPVKIYGNGFALKEFNDLPAEWRNYFFDSTDCNIANKMIEDVFTHETIAWSDADNKYKMFAGAFEQLANFLQKNKQ